MNRTFLLLLFSVLGWAATAQVTWDGGGDGINWSDAANWDTDVVPSAVDDIVIGDNVGTININSTRIIRNLEIGTGSEISINSGGRLAVRSSIPGETVTVVINGTITNNTGLANSLFIDGNDGFGSVDVSIILDGTGSFTGTSSSTDLSITGNNGINILPSADLTFGLETTFTSSTGLSAADGSELTFGNSSRAIRITVPSTSTFDDLTFDADGREVEFAGTSRITGNLLVTPNTTVDGVSANLEFDGDGTTQTITWNGALETGLNFIVINNALVQLQSDLDLPGDGNDFVVDGGTLDFNGFNITGVSGDFNLNAGKIIITSAEGIQLTGSTGNLQCDARILSSSATYEYRGSTNQVTGSALPSTLTTGLVIINNSGTVSLSQDTQFLGGSTPSSLEIQQGTFFTNGFNISGNGDLTVADGATYRSNVDGTVPEFGGIIDCTADNSTVELSGINQSLNGGEEYGNITFSGGGNYLISSATANIDGIVTITGGTVDIGNSTFGDGSTILNMSDGTFRYNGASTFPAMGTVTMTGGTLEFYRNGTQTLNGGTSDRVYNDINILAGSEVSLGTSTIINGTLEIASGGKFDISSNRSIQGNGNLIINAGSTFVFGHPEGIVGGTSNGAVRLSGSRTYASNANYEYDGSSNQSIGTDLPDINSGGSLKINNSGIVTLDRNLSFGDGATLDLTNGVLASGIFTLTINEDATILNASSASFIDGPVTASFDDATPSALTIPTGDGVDYRPVTLTPSSPGDFIVQHLTGPHPNASEVISDLFPAFQSTLATIRYWDIDDGGTGISTEVSLQVAGSDQVTTPSDLAIINFNGSDWSAVGNESNGGSDPYFVTANTASFGAFSLASTNSTSNPLPVELYSFTGRPMDNTVLLVWTTASEVNNDRFEVQRSSNGLEFEKIGEVNGNGNSSTMITYTFTDHDPDHGDNFYRLKQIDYDGAFEIHKTIMIRFSPAFIFNHLEIYPNPTTGPIEIAGLPNGADVCYELFSMTGFMSMSGCNKVSNTKLILDISSEPQGSYIIQITVGTQKVVRRVIKVD